MKEQNPTDKPLSYHHRKYESEWQKIVLKARCEPEDDETYHAKAYSGEYVSSTLLSTFRKSPYLYWATINGVIERADSPSFRFGRMAHKMILEPERAFMDAYAVGGPVNPKTGKPFGQETKAWADYEAEIGKPIISEDDYDKVNAMRDSVMTHPEAAPFLTGHMYETIFRTEVCSVNCQIKVDAINVDSYGLYLIDLKTCDDLNFFEQDAARFQYVHQAALYNMVFKQSLGYLDYDVKARIVAVEKRIPFRVGVFSLDSSIKGAVCDIDRELVELHRCRKHNEWPTGFEMVREI